MSRVSSREIANFPGIQFPGNSRGIPGIKSYFSPETYRKDAFCSPISVQKLIWLVSQSQKKKVTTSTSFRRIWMGSGQASSGCFPRFSSHWNATRDHFEEWISDLTRITSIVLMFTLNFYSIKLPPCLFLMFGHILPTKKMCWFAMCNKCSKVMKYLGGSTSGLKRTLRANILNFWRQAQTRYWHRPIPKFLYH